MTFVGPVVNIAWKDLILEIRTREVVASVLVFALLVVVVFSFALGSVPDSVRDDLVPGVLWVAFSFAGVLAMTRAFVLEKERGSIQGLLLAPVSRDAIYFGKMLASLIFMLVVEAAFLPIFAVLFNFTHFSPYLIVVLFLATLGFVAVGTLFSAIAVNTRSREIMLPVLFLPIVAPVIIAAVESTSALVGTGVQGVSAGRWMGLIGVFDMVFLVGCPWVFGLVVEE